MGPVVLATGQVQPSTHGPLVEQVGWGVARQVARRLAEQVGQRSLLDRLPELAEAPGWVAYAVFEGRDAVAVALLRLAGTGSCAASCAASYEGEVVADAAPAGTCEALLVRALHDAAAAGHDRLAVTASSADLAGWPRVSGR